MPELTVQIDDDHDAPPLAKKPCLDIPNGNHNNSNGSNSIPVSNDSLTNSSSVENPNNTQKLIPNGHINSHDNINVPSSSTSISRPPSASPLLTSPPPPQTSSSSLPPVVVANPLPPLINQSPPYHTNYRESDHNTTLSEKNSVILDETLSVNKYSIQSIPTQQQQQQQITFPASPPNLKLQHKSLVKEAKSLKQSEKELNTEISKLRNTIHESQLNIRAIDAQFQNQRLDGSKVIDDNNIKSDEKEKQEQQQEVNNLAIFFQQIIQHAKILTKQHLNGIDKISPKNDNNNSSNNNIHHSKSSTSTTNSPEPENHNTNSNIETENINHNNNSTTLLHHSSPLETVFNKHPPTTAIPANLLDKIGQFSDRKITEIVQKTQ